MVLVGAGGHAKEIIDIIPDYEYSCLFLFDNYSKTVDESVKVFKVIQKEETLSEVLKIDNRFVPATGDPFLREKLYNLFIQLGGVCTSVIAPNAFVSKFNISIEKGVNIMSFAFISNSVNIGTCSLINSRSNIHHNVKIGKFCEIGPGAILLGHVQVGDYTFIGAGAIVLPNVKIGERCIVAAGAVVTKDLSNGMKVKGVPAI